MDNHRQQRWQETRTRVGTNTRRLRHERGMTQAQLARDSGLSRNQIIELEQGRRAVLFEQLEDLASALGVPAAALFSRAGAQRPDQH